MLCDVGGWFLFLCYLFKGSADGNQRGRTSKHVWPWAVTANLNKHLSEAKRIWSAEININERSHRATTCQLKRFSLICIFPVLKVDLLSFLASYFYSIRAALHDSQFKITLTYLCLPSSSSCLKQAVLTAVSLRCPSLKLLFVLTGWFYSDLLAGQHPGLLRTITDQIHLNVKDFFYFSLLHIMETRFLDIYINKMFPRMNRCAKMPKTFCLFLLNARILGFYLFTWQKSDDFRRSWTHWTKNPPCAVCVLFRDGDIPCSVVFWRKWILTFKSVFCY